jgi:hypothetical protein
MSDDDITLDKKGEYFAIEHTNVVVHQTENKILGIAVLEEGEWILTIPVKPTKAMIAAAEEYDFDLPPTKEEIEEELELARGEINLVYRHMEELSSAYSRLEELSTKL